MRLLSVFEVLKRLFLDLGLLQSPDDMVGDFFDSFAVSFEIVRFYLHKVSELALKQMKCFLTVEAGYP